jgi:UDP-galactopyranose mutase
VGKKYDYLIVGSGLFGTVFAYRAKQSGQKVLVIDKRPQLGGNIYCENLADINVHKYGPHIFHTNNKQIWDFVNSFVDFNNYRHSVLANYKNKIFNLPFNMNTFYALWGITTPQEAVQKIAEQKYRAAREPQNLEEQAISLVGKDIYKILIKGYTEKQWGRRCAELPAFIIKRLPVRFTFDNNYFNDHYQGVPIGGYNKLSAALLKDVETKTGCDFFADRSYWENLADKIVYTGEGVIHKK